MPLIETKGAASAQGFGEFAASSGAVNYIEDVFSTYLYTGNGSIQSIPNGINLGPNTGNSNYFNAGQINTNSSASAFDLGTSDWTVECWIQTSYTSRIDPFELNGGTSSGFFGLTLNSSASGDIAWNESSGGSSVAVITATGTTVANGSWHNIAVTRSGNSVRLFFDGTQVGSTYTTSYTYGGASKAFRFGNRYPGGISSSSVFYISNFRIVKGTALYTTTFTPSTQPLTQISGTSYLGAQSLSSLEDTTLIGNSYANNVTPNGSGPFSYGTGSGGLVWCKRRDAANSNNLTDTARGANYYLLSNTTDASTLNTTYAVSAFNSNGFSLPAGNLNANAATYASWTFRKQPKFFDVVTWTGDGNAKTINHSLGSTPGCIIIKATSTTSSWGVYHRSVTGYGLLNLTNAWTTPSIVTATTDTTFSIIAGWNDPSVTYVAYLFAHNAGGFGLTGTDNVISCGSYTGNGADPGPDVNLGYEAQWVLIKNASDTASWRCFDVMRGMPVGAGDAILQPNSSAAESTQDCIRPTATGFQLIGADQAGGVAYNVSGNTYIYIAIRRGPMKVPTSGTSVFTPTIGANLGAGGGLIANAGFPPDLHLEAWKNTVGKYWFDRLRGANQYIQSTGTSAEATDTGRSLASMLGMTYSTTNNFSNAVVYDFRRAPSFFDEVCYTGTGSATTVTHNLSAVPQMMIVKKRSGIASWSVYTTTTGNNVALTLNSTSSITGNDEWNTTTPTSSVFSVGTAGNTNASAATFVAYLFATCAGVSKVGSYTGTGALQTVNCGFTSGARFVLIRRTDAAGDWYVYDSARGITSGNDPYLLLNDTAAEVTGTNYVDTDSTGFKVTAAGSTTVNISSATYIFLAIA